MIVLRLAKPFSVNAMYRSYGKGGRLTTIKSKAYRDWQAQTIELILKHKLQPVSGAFELQIVLPASNRFDLDNTVKAFADALRHAGVIKDDKPNYMPSLSVRQGREAFTKLTIIPLGADNEMAGLEQANSLPAEGRGPVE